MNEIMSILASLFGMIIWLFFIISIIRWIKSYAKKNMENFIKNNDGQTMADGKGSTQFTLNGKTYNNLEEYFGKYIKRTPESLKKIFGGLPNDPVTIQNKVKEIKEKGSDWLRSILFIVVVLVLIGLIFYYVK